MQWHSLTLEKKRYVMLRFCIWCLGRSPCHAAPSFEHTVLFLRSVVYTMAAKPNAKKKRFVIYTILHGVLERYNAMQCNGMQCNAMQCNGTAQR